MPLSPPDLPAHLAERTRTVGPPRPPRPPAEGGAFVVYWMRIAVRGHGNPALDVAPTAAARLGVPAFVYHALAERYPYASDRHHTFILEGAREVAEELAGRGIGHAFHLQRPGHRGAHLKTLAGRAALVVTEDMPVPPLRPWTERLAANAPAPVWAVDTACVVPMQLPQRDHDRAYLYRKATAEAREARLGRPWTDVEPEVEPTRPPFLPDDLPFEPLDLATADLPALVAACEIDHGVGPVPATRGGSRAGYERWRRFVDGGGLARYAGLRNDPLADGVSRLSPYLHYGMVSPLRIAREAAGELDRAAASGRSTKGPEKYLDELLVWREMSHTWCHHHREIDRDGGPWEALPEWARRTLKHHASDPRPAVYPWETLARAEVGLEPGAGDGDGDGDGAGDGAEEGSAPSPGEALWNACQRSLRVHGELHNNLRMTWGKALLSWSPDPRTALDHCLDLNHRYALDGRDPNSYGGILWCFGAFDRPFEPESPILGRVRGRSLEQHAGRLDMDAFARRTGRAAVEAVAEPPRVGILGSGMAGLACARTLADHGWRVTVLDKGRRPGGRVSTRPAGAPASGDPDRAAAPDTQRDDDPARRWPGTAAPDGSTPGGHDHGAQYFTARDPRFRRHVASWRRLGLVAAWRGRIVELDAGAVTDKSGSTERLVGVPGMDAVPRHLAAGYQRAGGELHQGWRAEALERRGGRWWIAGRRRGDGDAESAAEAGPFDVVVAAVPPAQAAPLLAAGAPELAQRAAAVAMAPCWAVLLTWDEPTGLPYDGAFVQSGPLSWVARDSSKPGRGGAETWVLHAGAEWSRGALELPREEVLDRLLAAFAGATGRDLPPPITATAHRWRFAQPAPALEEPCLLDPEAGLAACGDWCGGPRVEGAFLSGVALAGRLLGRWGSLAAGDG